jgi:hypothetical protein
MVTYIHREIEGIIKENVEKYLKIGEYRGYMYISVVQCLPSIQKTLGSSLNTDPLP